MNLAIEYLQRTGAIREFLKTPISFLVENSSQTDRLVVSLEEKPNCPSSFFVNHWILFKKSYVDFKPKKETYEILKNDVFQSPHVILNQYKPLHYTENAIKIDQNSYNLPIDIEDHNYIYKFFLNSKNHKMHKADCLWDSFTRLFFNGLILVPNKMQLNKKERSFVIDQEKKYIRMNFKNAWQGWEFWLSEFLSNNVVAPELIFYSAYSKVSVDQPF